MPQTIFFVVQTNNKLPAKFVAFDGADTDDIDEAKVFHSAADAAPYLKRCTLRQIECVPGKPTRLLALVSFASILGPS